MRRYGWMALVMVLVLPASGVRAQSDAEAESDSERAIDLRASEGETSPSTSESEPESGETGGSDSQCDYHVDCPSEHVCWRGSCMESSDALDVFESAEDECGRDRRCRIDRLKRKNQARRRAQKLEEEEYVEGLVDRRQQEELEEMPRRDKPIGIDLRASRMGVAGLVAGYTLLGRLRPELHFVHWPADVSVTVDDERFHGRQLTNFLIPGLYYFFMNSAFSPYASASFLYAWGTFDRSTFSTPGRDGPSTSSPDDLDTEYHALELGAGIDYQFEGLGAHLRLGLTYRPLIYNQARLSPGRYDERTKRALTNWFDQMTQIDVIFLAGWAF